MPRRSTGEAPPDRERPDEDLDPVAGAWALADEIFWRWDPQRDRIAYSRGSGLLPTGSGAAGHWSDRVHPDDLLLVRTTLASLNDGATGPVTFTCRVRHDDGSHRRIRVKAQRSSDDRCGHIVGTLLDVTDEHRGQDVFARLVRQNELILNAAGDGIYCLDAEGRSTFVNPAAARMLGTSVGGLEGVPLCRFRVGCTDAHGAVRHQRECPVEETLRTGLTHRIYDGSFERHDGRRFPVEYVVSPIHEQDRVAGAVVVFEDVTERRWSEEQIRRERRFSDGLIQGSLDGIVAFDGRLRVTVWNPAMERLTGLSSDAVMGRPLPEVVPFVVATGEIDHIQATLQGRTLVARDRPYHVRETGRSGSFEARYAPLHDERGEILGGVGIIHDTTERVAREEEIRAARDRLVRSQKLAALGTLVSGVGHELRTPMSYINNHLYLIKMLADRIESEDPAMAPVVKEIATRCDNSMRGITRMTTLLDDLRATYRPDDAEAKPVDLKRVVEEATRLFMGAYEGPVQVERHLEPTGALDLETGRIQQVVINLLSNAAEAMPSGGRIRIVVRQVPAGGELVVSDEGVGMSDEVRCGIFDPFYTTKKQGSGLGLYLVKQIVDRHMGTIECESVPGAGTTFRIVFPHKEPAEVAAPTAPAVGAAPALEDAVKTPRGARISASRQNGR